MATISRENIGFLNDKISVTVTKADYYPEFEKGLKKYAQSANIPGFRKGNIPMSVLMKKVGHTLLNEQVIKAVEKELRGYLEKLDVPQLGNAIPYQIEDTLAYNYNVPSDYTFAFEIGIQPEIKADISNVTFTKYKIQIDEKFIDEDIVLIRKKFGKYSEPETITTAENFLKLDVEMSDAEGNVSEELKVSKTINVLVSYFNDEYQAKLIGKKINDTIVFKVSDAFIATEQDLIYKDLGVENEEAQDAYYKATISGIGLQELADLNEELYKKAFPSKEITTEEELKAEIRKDIDAALDNQSFDQLKDQIYHQLQDHTEVALPEEFLKRSMKMSVDKTVTAEDLEKYSTESIAQVKWSLIINKFVKEFGVTVGKPDYIHYAKSQLINYFQSYIGGEIDMNFIDSNAEKMLSDNKFIERSYPEILSAKVFNQLASQAKTEEKAIELEEFQKLLHHHHH